MRAGQQPNYRATAQIVAEPSAGRIEMIALYSALALIAAVVFGTLSVHPF